MVASVFAIVRSFRRRRGHRAPTLGIPHEKHQRPRTSAWGGAKRIHAGLSLCGFFPVWSALGRGIRR